MSVVLKSSQEMAALSAAVATAAAQRVGCELLTAIVAEFSITSASPLGLPWDYHDRACRDMEERYLQPPRLLPAVKGLILTVNEPPLSLMQVPPGLLPACGGPREAGCWLWGSHEWGGRRELLCQPGSDVGGAWLGLPPHIGPEG